MWCEKKVIIKALEDKNGFFFILQMLLSNESVEDQKVPLKKSKQKMSRKKHPVSRRKSPLTFNQEQ